MVMLGTSLRRRRSAQASRVTRDSGRSLAPYPPTTVSLWTKPSTPLRSASTTRIRDSVGSADRDPAGAHRRSGARGRLLRLRTLAAVRGGQPYAGGGLLPSPSVYLTVTFAPVRPAMSSSPTLRDPSHTRASVTLK